MIVNLQSTLVIQLELFKKEIALFPLATREDIFSLIVRFLNGERLNQTELKIFKIDGRTKILEFKTHDHQGNWRVIAVNEKRHLVLLCAFHKKTQKLREKEKNLIRNRIKQVRL